MKIKIKKILLSADVDFFAFCRVISWGINLENRLRANMTNVTGHHVLKQVCIFPNINIFWFHFLIQCLCFYQYMILNLTLWHLLTQSNSRFWKQDTDQNLRTIFFSINLKKNKKQIFSVALSFALCITAHFFHHFNYKQAKLSSIVH